MSYDHWLTTDPDPCPEGREPDPYRCAICNRPRSCLETYCPSCKASVRSQRYTVAAQRKKTA